MGTAFRQGQHESLGRTPSPHPFLTLCERLYAIFMMAQVTVHWGLRGGPESGPCTQEGVDRQPQGERDHSTQAA